MQNQNAGSQDTEVVPARVAVIVRRFLEYSFSPVEYSYDNLTETEQGLCTREEYEDLKRWIQSKSE